MKYLNLALPFIIVVNSVVPRVADAIEPRWHQWMTTDVHGYRCNDLAFSPDGRLMVSVGSGPDSTRGIWATLPEQPGVVWAVAFSPDSKRVATAGNFQPIKLWDAAGCQEVDSLDVVDGGVFALAFSPDGQQLVAGGSRAGQTGDNQTGFITWWNREEVK